VPDAAERLVTSDLNSSHDTALTVTPLASCGASWVAGVAWLAIFIVAVVVGVVVVEVGNVPVWSSSIIAVSMVWSSTIIAVSQQRTEATDCSSAVPTQRGGLLKLVAAVLEPGATKRASVAHLSRVQTYSPSRTHFD